MAPRALVLAIGLLLASCGGGSGATSDGGPPAVHAGGTPTSATGAPATDAPTASDTSGPGGVAATAPPSAPPSAPPTTARDPVLGSGEAVTLVFAGDVHFEGPVRSALDRDPALVMAGVAPALSAADVAVVNLETAITERGTPAPKQFTFRAPPSAFDALRAAGVDAVTMANNHGMDFGQVGLDDSLAAASAAGFPVVGIGRDAAAAYRPWITEVRGQRIALIGATQVLDSSLLVAWTATDTQAGLASAKQVERLVAEVGAARAVADTVIVFLHWGTERETCPNDRQLELAPVLVAAGADVVVGSHAHRLMGGGRLDGAAVHYGLGNFVFSSANGAGAETGVFEVTITGRRVDATRWIPARISGGLPTLLEGDAAATAAAAWADQRACTGLDP